MILQHAFDSHQHLDIYCWDYLDGEHIADHWSNHMDPREFRENVLACRNQLDEEEPELWPHNLVMAQWIALVKA